MDGEKHVFFQCDGGEIVSADSDLVRHHVGTLRRASDGQTFPVDLPPGAIDIFLDMLECTTIPTGALANPQMCGCAYLLGKQWNAPRVSGMIRACITDVHSALHSNLHSFCCSLPEDEADGLLRAAFWAAHQSDKPEAMVDIVEELRLIGASDWEYFLGTAAEACSQRLDPPTFVARFDDYLDHPMLNDCRELAVRFAREAVPWFSVLFPGCEEMCERLGERYTSTWERRCPVQIREIYRALTLSDKRDVPWTIDAGRALCNVGMLCDAKWVLDAMGYDLEWPLDRTARAFTFADMHDVLPGTGCLALWWRQDGETVLYCIFGDGPRIVYDKIPGITHVMNVQSFAIFSSDLRYESPLEFTGAELFVRDGPPADPEGTVFILTGRDCGDLLSACYENAESVAIEQTRLSTSGPRNDRFRVPATSFGCFYVRQRD